MQTLILTLHVIVCVSLVILVLLQAGKEGMGVIFGGGSGSVFGSGGAGGMLSKLTAFMAALFILTSLSYNIITSSRPDDKSTILDIKLEETAPAKEPAPATPAAPAATGDKKAAVDPLDQTTGKK
ncbi:MAG: preprotein translocase subunit SecG [Desulfovibrionaceae bacterium]|nr:preprotein translocase subunit SecG [Desulfovibrionaceae bacterium]